MENELLSELLLRNKFDFSRNIFRRHEKYATNRKEVDNNFLYYKKSRREKASHELEDSTKLKVQNKTNAIKI